MHAVHMPLAIVAFIVYPVGMLVVGLYNLNSV
jgi:hypothetical protein